MGTISDKLMRIINTKEDIRQALISKGYDVPTSIPFKEYAKMISDLPCRVDSFPDIEGIVARYSALDLTNEQMAANPVWADKTGNGHDLQMKNLAWGGMSGVGGYSDNFSSDSWKKPSDRSDITWTSSSFNITRVMNTGVQIYYFSAWEESESVIPEKRIIVKGLEDGQVLRYMNVGNRIIEISQDGIYTIPSFTFKGANSYHGYSLAKKQESCNVTVEQLPLYPGALVFDGVDDYGVCDNFPILTKEKGYTVVALRSYLAESIGYLVYNGTSAKQSAFAFERSDSLDTWSWGKNSSIRNLLPKLMSYQTSNSYNNNIISTGTAIEGDKLIRIASSGGYCNVAIWELVFLDHDATEEELTKIKDYFVKTYPWLFFDQAWTVTGKTNEDEDRATIANITGNGNDLVLSNFAFNGNSGYGLYFFSSFHSALGTNANYTHIGYNQITLHNVKTEISRVYTFIKSVSAGQKIDFTIKISGLTALNEANPGFKINNSHSRAEIALDASSDGIYHIQGTIQESDYTYVTCTLTYDNGNIPTDLDLNVTIEQIPEYEGYLVTDGVDDKIDSSAFKMGEDFTVVGEWKLLPVSSLSYSGMLKNDNLYLYNNASTGLRVYIRSTDARNDMEGLKSLKAICSDGRVYGEDWTEYKLSIGSTIGSQSRLYLGYNNTAYTKMAFKNLGIYNNQILSKDDCIKAYNYLQTLKAK